MNRGNKAEHGDPGGNRGAGILAASEASLEEIVCLLARQRVAVSRAAVAGADWPGALRELQQEPATKVIVLATESVAPATFNPILAQVKRSDKPTVICLLGGDPRLAWRAGAIPARRLDEAARRAAAWIRGWDQALISAQLQEEDDQLLAQARELVRAAGRDRGSAAHVLAPPSLCHEARLMIAEVTGEGAAVTCSELAMGALPPIREAAADPGTAIVLLTTRMGTGVARGQMQALAELADQARTGGLLLCVHLYGTEQRALARGEAMLEKAGAIVARSNAAGARLVGLVLRQVAPATNWE